MTVGERRTANVQPTTSENIITGEELADVVERGPCSVDGADPFGAGALALGGMDSLEADVLSAGRVPDDVPL